MKICLSLLVASALLVARVPEGLGAQSAFKCPEWKSWPEDVRMMYLAGYVDGRQAGAFAAVVEFAPNASTNWRTDARVQALFAPELTVAEVASGVREFCADPRNRDVSIRSTVDIVYKEKTGMHKYTEAELERIRLESRRPDGLHEIQ